MNERFLILSASVGAGHMRAAQALELALRQQAPQAVVRNVDVLTLTNKTFRHLYGKLYLDLARKAPHVLGYFYDILDHAEKPGLAEALRLRFEMAILRKFADMLKTESWDVIISTHYLPAEIVAAYKRRGKLKTPQFVVTTDFETHRLWVHQPSERYFTATREGASYLRSFGVPENDIRATGIPIHPIFSQKKSREACLRNQGIRGELPVVLQLAGGFGIGPVRRIFERILTVKRPLELVVVTGRNVELKKELESVKISSGRQVKILGFTDQMDELMTAADLVVSKPGGLTTSEVLAKGAALAIVNPIPGQESRNSDFLLENGAAVKINHLATLPEKLDGLLADPQRLRALKKNAARLGKPQAAFDIAREAVSFTQ
jgi:processive 1,2-diacylglycerol beta-glucosyltransferase